MVVRGVVFILLAVLPVASVQGQAGSGQQYAACGCERSGASSAKKPRLLLPLAGGLGFLPVGMASRNGPAPVGLPSLSDIRDVGDYGPRNTLEGQRELAVGALAPDTATALPTVMAVAVVLVGAGIVLLLPQRRRRAWAFWRRQNGRSRGGWRLRTIHRRRIGGTVVALGGLLVVLGSREYAEGAEAQRRARAEWVQGDSTIAADLEVSHASGSRVPNGNAPSAVPLPVAAASGREIRRGTPVARLVIPAIDLDEIVVEGVGPVELNGGPGHFPGSALPGDAGNAIVSAHRDRHFRRFGELGIGSRIRTETRGRTVEWVITGRKIVSKDTPSLFAESEATLTLTTCWPIRYFGPAPDRLLIIAKPAS